MRPMTAITEPSRRGKRASTPMNKHKGTSE
jgi:hypothetical protein